MSPDSPFKLITTAIALDEGLTSVNDSFYCSGWLNVAGQKLKCHKYPASHGAENLAKGVENSCNPVFVTLSQRIGIDKFYEHLDSYGFTGTTGIDYPARLRPFCSRNSPPVRWGWLLFPTARASLVLRFS